MGKVRTHYVDSFSIPIYLTDDGILEQAVKSFGEMLSPALLLFSPALILLQCCPCVASELSNHVVQVAQEGDLGRVDSRFL